MVNLNQAKQKEEVFVNLFRKISVGRLHHRCQNTKNMFSMESLLFRDIIVNRTYGTNNIWSYLPWPPVVVKCMTTIVGGPLACNRGHFPGGETLHFEKCYLCPQGSK